MRNTHLVTVVGSHVAVLDQMLRHYRDIGLDSLLINVQLESYNDPLYDRVQRIASRYHAQISSVFVGKWLQSLNAYLYRHTMQQAPNDWFVVADSDEFQVYPSEIGSIFRSIDEEDFDYVRGFVIDRIGPEGVLVEIDANVDIWEQFPLAGIVTFPLLGGNILKVVAAKGSVKLSYGQHYAYCGTACPEQLYCIPVHHFKWTAGLLDRLRMRVQFYKSVADELWPESQRVVDYYERNGEKLNVSDPAFLLQQSGRVCPHEKDLRALVEANSRRMPRPKRED